VPGELLPSVTGKIVSPEGLVVGPEVQFEDAGIVTDGGSMCDPCMPNCCGTWNSCGPVPIRCLLPRPPLDNLELFAGVEGFTGPLNRGGNGSFGFHEGFNWGMPIGPCLAWQWGAMATQSTFDGSFLTTDDRNQCFVTGGFFRRVDCGLQGGLVVDFLHDEADYEADLIQLRGEFSLRFACSDDVGFWFTAGLHEANNLQLLMPQFASDGGVEVASERMTAEVNSMFALFYRRQFACGGEGRLFGGFTANDQGLVGADLLVQINPCWGLRAGFLYIAPDGGETATERDFSEETWNVGISLVWTPCPRSIGGANYGRPLFNVADNGSFATRLVRESGSN
jgi:hypothetical protein